MTLNLQVPERNELKPRLTVFGVGGAGGNAVNNMIARSLEGVDFVVANTDAQALALSEASHKIQLGEQLTEGLGAGAKPEVGARAAEESLEKITDFLVGSHMCFITAGMGGGTGTGAAPIIAQAARSLGILTVGVVTKPFGFEGGRRSRLAEEGIAELQRYVDTLIIIPNQNLFRMATENTLFTEAFAMADDVLYQGVKGVTDLMVRPGLVNLDFADVKSVMDEMGKAMMGTGEAEGEDRALEAAKRAIANPLLDEISLAGARGVLINITGGQDMTIYEVDEAVNQIQSEVDPEANIIFGASHDDEMTGKIRVSVVATGIDAVQNRNQEPNGRRQTTSRATAPAQTEAEDLFSSVAKKAIEPIVAEQPVEEFALREEPVEKPIAAAPVIEDDVEADFEIEATTTRTSIGAFEEDRLEAPGKTNEAPTFQIERTPSLRDRFRSAARMEPPAAPVVEPSVNTIDDGDNAGRKPSGVERYSFMRNSTNEKGANTRPATERSQPRTEPREPTLNERVDIPAFLRRQAN